MTNLRLHSILRNVPNEVTLFAAEFHRREKEIFIVGGAVRSALLGLTPADFDFATDAAPEEVMSFFRRVVPTGIAHGTVTVLFRGWSFEVTTYRADGTYSDHRRPDTVVFGVDLSEDLKRRDFTINAMALDPVEKRFIDPHEGEQDLGRRLVRAIGNPVDRFREDALRTLRAVRFASQLDFEIAQHTREAISAVAMDLRHVSVERVTDEFNKILLSPAPARGLTMLNDLGLLAQFLPELAAGVGVEQRGEHRFDVFEHSIRACQNAPAELPLRLAALLHDVAKPVTVDIAPDGTRTFYRHDQVGADLAESVLRRLKYPTATIKRVVHLVRHHMFAYSSEWSDAAVRRFIARIGKDHIRDIVELRKADSAAIKGERPATKMIVELLDRVDSELQAERAFTVRDLAANGHDLIQAGIPRGPVLGVILEELLHTVVDDPSQNVRDKLIEIAQRLYAERIADRSDPQHE